jgi:tetratricopeptide (TPR) repeat protein
MHPNSRHKPLVLLLGLLLGAVPPTPAQAAKKAPARAQKEKKSTPRASPGKKKDFNRYLVAAVRLYESLEYERALVQLERARRLVDDVKQDVLLSLYEGSIQADLGRMEEARASFKTALLLEPEATLPLRVSPKVEREFEAMRVRVRKELAIEGGQTVASTDERPEPADATEPEPTEPRGSDTPAEPRVATASPTTTPTDRPEQQPTRTVALVPTPPSPALTPSVAARKRPVPTVSLALAGASVVAGGVGTYFGLSSRNQLTMAGQSFYADEAAARLDRAQGNALAANVLLGTAGVAAAGALVTWLLLPGSPPATAEASPAR